MYCYKHNERPAVGACTNCGHLICEECKLEVNEKFICKDCAEKMMQSRIPQRVNRPASVTAPAGDADALPVRIICFIILLYGGYSLIANISGFVMSISKGGFVILNFAVFFLRFIMLGGTIAYCVIKVIKPRLSCILAIIILAGHTLLSLFLHARIIKLIGFAYSRRLPMKTYIGWYLLPILLLILILVDVTTRKPAAVNPIEKIKQ